MQVRFEAHIHRGAADAAVLRCRCWHSTAHWSDPAVNPVLVLPARPGAVSQCNRLMNMIPLHGVSRDGISGRANANRHRNDDTRRSLPSRRTTAA